MKVSLMRGQSPVSGSGAGSEGREPPFGETIHAVFTRAPPALARHMSRFLGTSSSVPA